MARLTSMDGVAFTGEDSAQYSGVSNDLDKIVTTTESKYLLKAVSPPTVVLETQYRFNSAINSCISELVYGGKLSPSPFVADRTLANSLPVSVIMILVLYHLLEPSTNRPFLANSNV